MATKIPWTEATWNPIIGCSHASPGCDNCYAERMAKRLFHMQAEECNGPYYELAAYNGWTGKTVFVESALEKPLHWKKPRQIFVCSMADLFHESVPFEWIDRVMGMITLCPQHTFQVLTKRPERMLKYFGGWYSKTILPIENLWLGVTAENQEQADIRIPILLQIPAALRFVSVEPMLGKINLGNVSSAKNDGDPDSGWYGKHGGYPYLNCLTGREYCVMAGNDTDYKLDWVIIGAESGPGRRKCEWKWPENLVNQCHDAGVPCFVKQIHHIDSLELIKSPVGWPREMPLT